jgi:hypothetical protein
MSVNENFQSPQNIATFQIQRPIRGIIIDLVAVHKIYMDLAKIVEKEADNFISTLKKPDDRTDEQFDDEKKQIRRTAFKVTVTIKRIDGANLYGETIDVFNKDIMPSPVTGIFMTNGTAYAGVFKAPPKNHFTFLPDFGKPAIVDWSSIVSYPTANNSNLAINGLDVTFVRSVESSILNPLQYRRSPWKYLHAPFAYDFGLWFIAVPYAIYSTTKFVIEIFC